MLSCWLTRPANNGPWATALVRELIPHLESVLSLKDVALVINLWEDKEGRLTTLRKPLAGKAAAARREEHARAAGKGRRR